MSRNETQPDIASSKILIDSQCPTELFSFKWRISNYSKLINPVCADFSTIRNVTSWRIELDTKFGYDSDNVINLIKMSEGPTITVTHECSIRSKYSIKESKYCNQYERRFHRHEIMNFSYEQFENDTLELECDLRISGHTITNQMKMPDLKRTNQLAFDLKSILGKQEHCDITLSVGGKKIPVHKAILCARSPVFNMMYQHDMVENQNKEVEIEDIDFGTLQQFVNFLYSADLEDLDLDKAKKLYYAADKYDVKDLRDACSEFLRFSLTVDEACDVLVLSDQHKDEELKSAVRFFMQMHSSAIKNTDSWKILLKSNPKLVLEFMQ